MASKTTDPGLGAPDTARTHDTAVTDPMSGAGATTDPATDGDNTTPDAEPDTNPERGDDLLEGLRRERPPPRLSPRIRPESEGAVAAAYYAGPQSLPARFDTPAPEDAVEIATTPAGPTTEPLARVVPPAAGASPPSPVVIPRKAVNEPTVPTRRKKRSPRATILGVVLIASAGLAAWFALRMGGDLRHEETSGSASALLAPAISIAPPPSSPAIAAPRASEPASPAPVSSPSPAAVRIETTASSARPNGHPPVSGAPLSPPSAPPRATPHPPVAPATTPSTEPHPTPPSVAPSAKIDHVRTI